MEGNRKDWLRLPKVFLQTKWGKVIFVVLITVLVVALIMAFFAYKSGNIENAISIVVSIGAGVFGILTGIFCIAWFLAAAVSFVFWLAFKTRDGK